MNILQLDLGREWRGGQRQVLYLSRHLHAGAGTTPIVAAPRGAALLERAAQAGIETLPLGGRFEWNPALIFLLRKLIVSRPIDIVHTHCAKSASLGAVLKKICPTTLVHSRRVSYALGGGWSRAKYCLADVVVAVSAEIARTLQAAGVDPHRIRVIHSGVDPQLYDQAAQAGPLDRPVFGVVGALTPQKGHEVFLKALALVAEAHPDAAWTALIVGDGPLRGEIESLSHSLGLGDRVTFTGYRESAEVLGGFSALVVPSVDGEGSSGTIKEGWAASVPVICSDLESNLELVVPGSSGLTFESKNSQALAAALTHVSGLDGQAPDGSVSSLVKGGRERLNGFTHTAMAQATTDLYAEILGNQ